jgi:hypothetical protein
MYYISSRLQGSTADLTSMANHFGCVKQFDFLLKAI